MTPNAAATALGISRQRVMQLINSGRLAAVMVDGKWDVGREAIDTYKPPPRGRPRGDAR